MKMTAAMETYKLNDDLKVFGLPVKNFPAGIKETFDKLLSIIPDGFGRPYYGISRMTDKGMLYMATALEKSAGEARKYNCQEYRIEKGEYLTVTVKDWTSKTDTINGIFHNMLENPKADKTKPCVEWYKNDKEMLCMVKLKEN